MDKKEKDVVNSVFVLWGMVNTSPRRWFFDINEYFRANRNFQTKDEDE